MYDGDKAQPPYRGFWVVVLALILMPAAFCFVVDWALTTYNPMSRPLHDATVRTLGLGCGFLFHMICLVGGAFRADWQALKYRVSEFFENLVVGLGYALQTYFEDVCQDGMTFTLYMLIIAANLALAIHSLLKALALIGII